MSQYTKFKTLSAVLLDAGKKDLVAHLIYHWWWFEFCQVRVIIRPPPLNRQSGAGVWPGNQFYKKRYQCIQIGHVLCFYFWFGLVGWLLHPVARQQCMHGGVVCSQMSTKQNSVVKLHVLQLLSDMETETNLNANKRTNDIKVFMCSALGYCCLCSYYHLKVSLLPAAFYVILVALTSVSLVDRDCS